MEHEPKKPKPVDWDELYPGRFLKAGLLGDKHVTLTITDVDREALQSDEGKKVKGIITFKGTDMQLALNKTNGICLREMFGRKLADWIGKRVVLFASSWNGEPCIRIYGSPDIASDMQVQVQLPRRKPIRLQAFVGCRVLAPSLLIQPGCSICRAALISGQCRPLTRR